MLKDYAVLGIFIIGGFIFTLIAIFINWLVRPKKPDNVKEETWECGHEPIGNSWVQFKVNYFLYALIFLVFDIETVFLYPWAVKFKVLGMFGLVEMLVFIAVLLIGVIYAWKKGALEWK